MASLIPGYNYDIFISYRQKDNKHDGWVTEFVNQLKGELGATFKEDISIYFDENPHDGLLETHSVDKSLEDKLKCLIFIPIISQTYCDSKSFAWQHEFCAFNKLANEDQFGRDIRLTSGNVASRILPVKIHDLDPEDKALLETELGGVLRSVEFIYTSAGVNRPLRANEDHPQDNLNKTYYRDQINKVANAVKEIIGSLKKHCQHQAEVSKQDFGVKPANQKNLRTKIIAGILILLALIVTGYFIVPKLFKPQEQLEKSIAVLPFRNDSPDQENTYFINGIMEEVLNNLQKIKEFRVLSRTSTDQYQGQNKPTIPEIAKKLDVNYIVEGSGQKYSNKFVLRVQLIAADNERHLWAKSYDREILQTTDIINIQSEIAQAIASELKAIMTPEEKRLTDKIPTTNLTAYDLYMKANSYRIDFEKTRDVNTYHIAATLYKAALELDSSFAKAYVGLGWIYADRYYWSNYYKENFMDTCLVMANKALSFDDDLELAYYLKGWYYRQNGFTELALDYFDKTLKINPNYYNAYSAKGYIFGTIKFDMVKALENDHKALKLISGNIRPTVLRNLAGAYGYAGFTDKARQYHQEALALDGKKNYYLVALAAYEFDDGNFEKAFRLAEEANKIDSTYLMDMIAYNVGPGHDKEAYLQAKKWIEYYRKRGELDTRQSYRVGYAYWKVGKFQEAEYYLNQQIKYSEESIKLNRDDAQWGRTYLLLGITYAFKGEKEKAYQNLEKLSKMNSFPLVRVTLLKYDPMLANIRNEERFKTIMKTIEDKYKAEHERVRKWLEENNML